MSAPAVSPGQLRCEYAESPIGIDVKTPRLSWTLRSAQRAQRQTAYQILVSGDRAQLARQRGDLWDSGKVEADDSIHIPYAGKPLRSGQRCFWQVRVWDRDGNVSAYSAPSFWEMGLLDPADWQAAWIGIETGVDLQLPSLEGCSWVWSGAGQGLSWFRREVSLPPGAIRRAYFVLTADRRFTLWANGREAARGTYWKVPQSVDLGPYLRPGPNVLAIEAETGSNPAGILGRLRVDYASGETVTITIDKSWTATARAADGWQEGAGPGGDWDAAPAEAGTAAEWLPAREVAVYGAEPWGALAVPPPAAPCPHLRREFALRPGVRRARLYATALGLYELSINGKRVGEDQFTPGWTEYRKRVQYQTYDVTDLLRPGSNAVGAILADGWYAGDVAIFGRHQYGPYPLRLRMQLEVEFEDGQAERVVSDRSWKGTTGPLQASDMMMGETYDARMEMPGWDSAGFDDRTWRPVDAVVLVPVELVAQIDPPVRRIEELRPVALAEPSPGTWIFDMGQNMVGRVRLLVRGAAGTQVTLRFGEMVRSDGTLYTDNLRSARQTDIYLLKGEGEEVFEPRFTFHGFRYVEVSGYPGVPGPEAITGVVIHSATLPAGRFTCSSPLVNQLQRNITWGQRGNFLSVPTDCPQRDERMGWLGDAQIFARTACFNADVAGFFTKWMVDVEDAQRESGAFTDVAPQVGFLGAGAAAWADAGVIIPWTIYLCYGDTRIIERHYEAMARWIEYLQANSPGYLRPAQGYGDWLSIDAETPKDVLGTAYFAYSARLMARMAGAIGRHGDAARYEELFRRVREAFNTAYVRADGRIQGETQTCYLLALHMDLLPETLRAVAADHLVAEIERRDWHLSTGFVGVSYLNPVLSETGHLDVAYRLLLSETYPSWLYPIQNGATTMWERWNSYTRETGFGDIGMNSFNHYCFGSVGEWLYRYVAGMDADPECPGYRHVIIHPRPGGGLSWARAEYESVRGRIVSAWSREGGRLILEVEIPVGAEATVHVPAADVSGVIEGEGTPADRAEGVRCLYAGQGKAMFRVGSGRYRFTSA